MNEDFEDTIFDFYFMPLSLSLSFEAILTGKVFIRINYLINPLAGRILSIVAFIFFLSFFLKNYIYFPVNNKTVKYILASIKSGFFFSFFSLFAFKYYNYYHDYGYMWNYYYLLLVACAITQYFFIRILRKYISQEVGMNKSQ